MTFAGLTFAVDEAAGIRVPPALAEVMTWGALVLGTLQALALDDPWWTVAALCARLGLREARTGAP
ncbi:hypothetical protein [Prauserella muralis]|uniref:Uncharacterized protein n=1 Tax=Prauserella muralis TaxID=588067 RepID=A0A2V4AM92_9PSEU|nr:hypothetical protein [Prauserella muralis]PXY21153.1 hypothetical protein BAY60_27180 [Prauserella muralis]TWE30241.1 hypothetical protein FHX69_2938 [Prauserella muralis]